MKTEILVTMISGLVMLVCCIITTAASVRNGKNAIDDEFKRAVLERLTALEGNQAKMMSGQEVTHHRIDQLERKQDQSNAVKERLAKVEARLEGRA